MLGTSSAQKTSAPLLSRYKRQPVDKMLLTVMLLLLSSGLLVLFSATYYTAQDAGDPLREVRSQLLGIALGAVACFVTSRIPYRFWKDTWVVVGLLILSAVLLTLVIIPGVGVYINGSRRWLSLGGLSFQPSELAKFSVVMFLATTLCYRGRNIRSLFRGIVPVLLVPGVVFLLILQQPNLSTAGSILITSLILLTVMTILGLTAMRGSTLSERMALNAALSSRAFQAAESALRDAEQTLRHNGGTNDTVRDVINEATGSTSDVAVSLNDDQMQAKYNLNFHMEDQLCEGNSVGKVICYHVQINAVGSMRDGAAGDTDRTVLAQSVLWSGFRTQAPGDI